MNPNLRATRRQRGQAMTELIVTMPVIALFFVAVFYFGYGMNQKIENTMAVHYAAFVHGADRGRDPDELLSVTAGQLRSAFFSRDRNVALNVANWTAPRGWYAGYATDSFNTPYNGNDWYEWIQWLPNRAVGLYLSATGQPSGTHAVTRTTIDANGIGFRPIGPLTLPSKTVTAELYLDQKTRKLETASFNLGEDPWDPGQWDFGYMPAMLTYMVGWDWDFSMNCFSLIDADTPWICG
jgi:hypothetical protein